MAKKGKKRQRSNRKVASSFSSEPQCHIRRNVDPQETNDSNTVIGSGTNLMEDSIESCLADLEEATNPLYVAEFQKTKEKQETSRTPTNEQDQGEDTIPVNSFVSSLLSNNTNEESTDYPFVDSSLISRKERLKNWDDAFEKWINSGSGSGSGGSGSGQYTVGLLPCFETELHRHIQVKKLSTYLLDAVKDLKMPAFERWLLDSKLEERQQQQQKQQHKRKKIKTQNNHNNNNNRFDDPVLPTNPTLGSESSQRLIEEICETGIVDQRESAERIVKELFQQNRAALREIQSQSFRCSGQTPYKSDKIAVEVGSYLVSFLFSKKKWKSPYIVKINITHYNKLRRRFLDTHQRVVRENDVNEAAPATTFGSSSSSSSDIMTGRYHSSSSKSNNRRTKKVQHALHLLMMVMTLRYSSLSGGQLLDDFRGGGMQGAINEEGFRVLRTFFPAADNWNLMECFGSPLNATLPCFASAFESLDWHFGSAGDLASCPNFRNNTCAEANPPFTPAFMEFLATFISKRLQQANQNSQSLSFVVIVPAVHEKDWTAGVGGGDNEEKRSVAVTTRVASAVKRFAARAHGKMTGSKGCSLHIVLPAKEHGYVEGAQHLRPTRYKRSLYDTSVILLQSQKAQEANLDKENFESSIRKAFAERHSRESKERAMSKS